jgi:S1-C subfamily serine protease
LKPPPVIPSDIITAIEGKPVNSVGKLVARLDDSKVGDKTRITAMRQGKRREVPVILQAGE